MTESQPRAKAPKSGKVRLWIGRVLVALFLLNLLWSLCVGLFREQLLRWELGIKETDIIYHYTYEDNWGSKVPSRTILLYWQDGQVLLAKTGLKNVQRLYPLLPFEVNAYTWEYGTSYNLLVSGVVEDSHPVGQMHDDREDISSMTFRYCYVYSGLTADLALLPEGKLVFTTPVELQGQGWQLYLLEREEQLSTEELALLQEPLREE